MSYQITQSDRSLFETINQITHREHCTHRSSYRITQRDRSLCKLNKNIKQKRIAHCKYLPMKPLSKKIKNCECLPTNRRAKQKPQTRNICLQTIEQNTNHG